MPLVLLCLHLISHCSLILQEVEEDIDETTVSTAESQKRKRTRTTPEDPYEFDVTGSQSASGSSTKRSKKAATQESSQGSALGTDSAPMETIDEDDTPASISEERFNLFKKSLTQLFRESRAQSLPSSRFREYLVEKHSAQPFRAHEIRAAFERMTDANQIMVADDIIFLI